MDVKRVYIFGNSASTREAVTNMVRLTRDKRTGDYSYYDKQTDEQFRIDKGCEGWNVYLCDDIGLGTYLFSCDTLADVRASLA